MRSHLILKFVSFAIAAVAIIALHPTNAFASPVGRPAATADSPTSAPTGARLNKIGNLEVKVTVTNSSKNKRITVFPKREPWGDKKDDYWTLGHADSGSYTGSSYSNPDIGSMILFPDDGGKVLYFTVNNPIIGTPGFTMGKKWEIDWHGGNWRLVDSHDAILLEGQSTTFTYDAVTFTVKRLNDSDTAKQFEIEVNDD